MTARDVEEEAAGVLESHRIGLRRATCNGMARDLHEAGLLRPEKANVEADCVAMDRADVIAHVVGPDSVVVNRVDMEEVLRLLASNPAAKTFIDRLFRAMI